MISIGFDARYIRVDHHDGISRYSARVGSELWSLAKESNLAEVTFIVCDERQLSELPKGSAHVVVSSPTSLRERRLAKQLNNYKFDVVYSPMQTMGTRGRHFRAVLTVHDLIYYTHPMPPRSFSPFIRLLWRLYHLTWWPQRWLLNSAEHVIAVSQTTRGLIERHHLTTKPVSVVYNASDLNAANFPIQASHSEPLKNLVYMGAFLPYKNVQTLIELSNTLPEYTLHLLSRINLADRKHLEEQVVGGNVVFHNGVTDEEYIEILSTAHAGISLSLDEGFGIPVLEAMTVGVPFIASDIPIFHEVAGDAAIFVDPHDVETAVHAVRMLEDKSVRDALIRKGHDQASRFSWNQSAQDLLNVLVDVVRSKA